MFAEADTEIAAAWCAFRSQAGEKLPYSIAGTECHV